MGLTKTATHKRVSAVPLKSLDVDFPGGDASFGSWDEGDSEAMREVRQRPTDKLIEMPSWHQSGTGQGFQKVGVDPQQHAHLHQGKPGPLDSLQVLGGSARLRPSVEDPGPSRGGGKGAEGYNNASSSPNARLGSASSSGSPTRDAFLPAFHPAFSPPVALPRVSNSPGYEGGVSSTEVSPLKPSVFLHVRDAAHAKATAAKFKRMHARGAGAEDGFATEALSKSKALLKEWQRRERQRWENSSITVEASWPPAPPTLTLGPHAPSMSPTKSKAKSPLKKAKSPLKKAASSAGKGQDQDDAEKEGDGAMAKAEEQAKTPPLDEIKMLVSHTVARVPARVVKHVLLKSGVVASTEQLIDLNKPDLIAKVLASPLATQTLLRDAMLGSKYLDSKGLSALQLYKRKVEQEDESRPVTDQPLEPVSSIGTLCRGRFPPGKGGREKAKWWSEREREVWEDALEMTKTRTLSSTTALSVKGQVKLETYVVCDDRYRMKKFTRIADPATAATSVLGGLSTSRPVEGLSTSRPVGHTARTEGGSVGATRCSVEGAVSGRVKEKGYLTEEQIEFIKAAESELQLAYHASKAALAHTDRAPKHKRVGGARRTEVGCAETARTAGMPRERRNGGVAHDWWLGDSPTPTPRLQKPRRGEGGGEGERGKGMDVDARVPAVKERINAGKGRCGGSARAMPFAWGEDGV